MPPEAPAAPPTRSQPSPSSPPSKPGPGPRRLRSEVAKSERGIQRSGRLYADRLPQLGRSVNPPSDTPNRGVRVGRAQTPSADRPVEDTLVVSARARSTDDGARVHVVQPGDSLWAIAETLLGPGASSARVSREVQRLWSLNHERIGTGDPDLLMVGTELRLT